MKHRIRYDVLETVAGIRYRATCICGEHRTARHMDTVSAWGPEHVVRAYEKETATV